MRCPKGFKQQPPKSGICVKNNKSQSKRCANGTRKNKKTGNCETSVKKSKSKSKKLNNNFQTEEVKKNKMWKIYKIDYIYPSINTDNDNKAKNKSKVTSSDYGSMNIESIFIENEENVVQIIFENKKVEIAMGKKQDKHPKIVWEENASQNIKDLDIDMNSLNSNSNIAFFGMENDEDANYTTKENFDAIKDGSNGKYIKINVKDPYLDSDSINDTIKDQILEKAIEVIKHL